MAGNQDLSRVKAACCFMGDNTTLMLDAMGRPTFRDRLSGWQTLYVYLVAAWSALRFIEYFPTSDIANFAEFIDNPVIVRDEQITVPQKPGPGFDFVMEAVEKYALVPAVVGTHVVPTQFTVS
ncbi:hypothetical protein THS27_12340 [Thalassospira sp. MCCC 1A01428]|nr:hypothetical protein THS27_12340 [Thalassospira sp. MCCC 1A01428]